MDEQEVLQILNRVGAVIPGHFVYAFGKHGSYFIDIGGTFSLYRHINEMSELCLAIAEKFTNSDVQVVIGPATGGKVISLWTANHLTQITGKIILGICAEKTQAGHFIIEPDYCNFITGKKVLIVDDVLTTGYSVREVTKIVLANGGQVIGLGVICNRGGVTTQNIPGVPELFALANIKLDSWNATECPLCTQNVPINTDVGHGRGFLASKAK